MAKYCVTNGNLYENGIATEMKVATGCDLRIQGVGSGEFTVMGKLTANGTAKPLAMIRMSDFQKVSSISDNEIYAGDVAGLYSITVEASGVTKVYASILSE